MTQMCENGSGFTRRKRGILSGVFLAIIYVDVASIVNLSDLPFRLPNAPLAREFNGMFRVFATWTDEVSTYQVELTTRRKHSTGVVEEQSEHDVHQLFPMPRAESFIRIYLLVRESCERVASELRKVYQLREADRDVMRLRLQRKRWPASPEGFFALYESRETEELCTVGDR